MTNNPIFSAGQTVWHLRHGKVILEACSPERLLIMVTHDSYDFVRPDGTNPDYACRVLYSLAEAEQYGWLPKEPLRAEFRALVVGEDGAWSTPALGHEALRGFEGKVVRVTVEEILE